MDERKMFLELHAKLEVAIAAGFSPDEFSQGTGTEIARRSFEKVNEGAMKAIVSAQHLSGEAAQSGTRAFKPCCNE